MNSLRQPRCCCESGLAIAQNHEVSVPWSQGVQLCLPPLQPCGKLSSGPPIHTWHSKRITGSKSLVVFIRLISSAASTASRSA